MIFATCLRRRHKPTVWGGVEETPGIHIADAKKLIAIPAYETGNKEHWGIPFGVHQLQPLPIYYYDAQLSKLAVTRGLSCPLQHY